ncbi:MAG: hypothetical protein GEU92_20825, partial [Alphaproteobacteria bacterium]|nr:hypothetical protein [Alphaproteobacteria bacterium]
MGTRNSEKTRNPAAFGRSPRQRNRESIRLEQGTLPPDQGIRARILERTRLTASAGISYNKFLAKLASDQRKPNGQFVITPEMDVAFVEALPVTKFHGVGPVTAVKMQRLGIETGSDLRSKPL